MIAEAIQKIISINKSKVHEIDGNSWYEGREGLKLVRPNVDRQECFMLGSLDGLKDYIEIEKPPDGSFIAIHSPSNVALFTEPHQIDHARTFLASATPVDTHYQFGHSHGIEHFLILLQTGFATYPSAEGDNAPESSIKDLVAKLSHIKSDESVTFEDNGVNQNVVMKNQLKAGEVSRGSLPNPVILRPYRSFREIRQPRVSFLLRMHKNNDGVQVVLHESRSMEWVTKANSRIKAWIKEHIPSVPVIG